MFARILSPIRDLVRRGSHAVHRRVAGWLRPATTGSLVVGPVADLALGRPELIAENALLRQQLIVLGRTTKRPLSWLLGLSRCAIPRPGAQLRP